MEWGRARKRGGTFYFRPNWAEMEFVGEAPWMPMHHAENAEIARAAEEDCNG